MAKTIEYYLGLPYSVELVPEDDGSYFVRIPDLPGCMSAGETPEEAIAMIREAMVGWLEVALKHELAIPEPRPQDGYSGKFVLRVPTSLHRDLAEAAEREGVSLNQYCNVALARTVGHRQPVVARATEELHEPDIRIQAERQAAEAFQAVGSENVIRVRREWWISTLERRGVESESPRLGRGIR